MRIFTKLLWLRNMNEEIRRYMAENGRKGGLARAKKLSPERRVEIGKHAVNTRHRRKKNI